ncbi:MAG: outer membrane protein assembly factor BamB [Halobacteriales archaeon]|jgi:outer membrane protein assembly factor BamB
MAIDRRRFLELAGAAAATGGTVALAGCTSSCPDSDRPTPDRTISIRETPAGPFDEPPPGDWPTLHGTGGRTGFAGGSLPDRLGVRWRTDLDVPSTDEGSLSTSAPTVGDGTVVVADSRRVHALSIRTGEHRWRSDPLPVTVHDTLYEYQANTVSPAIGPGGDVYVGTREGLTALDGSDGSVRWAVGGMTDVAPPAVTDEGVFALGRESITATDRSGEERWRRSVARGAPPVAPALGDSIVVVAADDGVRGLDPATGDERWTANRRIETYPVVDDGACFVGTTEGLHAIDVASGAEDWTFSRGDYRALLSPVITSDTIYVVEQPGEAGAASFALDRTDGTPDPRWCSYVGSGAVTAATDGLALAILSIGEGPDAAQAIVAFSKSLGQARWAIEGGSRPRDWVTPPAVVDGAVVATTRGGTIVALGEVGTDG